MGEGIPSAPVIEAGKKASNVILDQGTLGALVVLLAIAVGLLIWSLIKSKNAHISDKDKMTGLLNVHSLESQGLLKDLKNAIDNLAREFQLLQQSIKEIDNSVDALSKDNVSIIKSDEEIRKALDTLGSQWEKWKMSQKRSV